MARYARADQGLLAMALVGYEKEKARIDTVIAEIRAKLGRAVSARQGAAAGDAHTSGQKRILSAAARRRIALAQKKRWAAVRKAKAAAKPARRLSAAGRKAIVEALRKRWAAARKAKAQKPAAKPKGAAAKTAKKPAEQAASATA